MKPVDPAVLRQAPALRRHLVELGGFGAVSAVLIVAQASLLAAVVAPVVVGGAGLSQEKAPIAVLAAVVLLRGCVAWAMARTGARTSIQVRAQLRSVLVTGALRRGPVWLAGEQTGELAMTATTGLDALDGYVTRYLPQLVLAGLLPIVLLGRMALADPTSAAILAVTLPLIPVFLALVGLQAQDRMRSQWSLLQRLSGHFLDVVTGLPTLRIFGRARTQTAAVRAVTDRYRRETLVTLRVAFLSGLVLELLATLSVALVAVEIGLRLVSGRLSFETALLVLLLAPEVHLPLRAVGTAFHACADGLEAATRAVTVADSTSTAPTTAALPAARPAESDQGARLDAVTVRYPGREAPVLRNFSLTVAPGEVVALLGPSGTGKSTVLSVLLGFLRPTAGAATLDGAPLADGAGPHVAWVPQLPKLPGRALRDVVRLGVPTASDQDVRAALHAAGADFVADLDDATGEDGLRWSTGQRRRLALARALLAVRAGARLLLLDEPSEGLEPEAEVQVAALIDDLRGTVPILLVTHSPTLAAAADRSVVLASPLQVGARP